MDPHGILFFDHMNGGPPLPGVAAAMGPWLGRAANPQAAHRSGRSAHMALEAARAGVAALVGAQAEQVLFGASGTEVNNLGLKGFLKANRRRGDRILVSAIEHTSISRAARRMADSGYRVDTVAVDREGRVRPETLAKMIDETTALVCVQLANPEVGTVQDIPPLAEIAHRHKAALLVDGVAACGRMRVDLGELGADLFTLAAAPMWGPAGAAALVRARGIRLQPELDGGIQEQGVRGGLENVAAIVGLGVCAQAARAGLAEGRAEGLADLAGRFSKVASALPGVRLSGPETGRLPGHASLLVDGVEGESLLALLDREGVAASSGSYCGAQAMKASETLTALGYAPEQALSGVVFAFGPANSPEEVDRGGELLRKCLESSRLALSRAPR